MFETRDAKFRRLANVIRKLHLDKPIFYVYIYIVERIWPSQLMKREREFYNENREKINYIIDNLADELSKNTYNTCLEFRTTRKRYMNSIKREAREQYFSSDVVSLDNESFVDCGAYTGDTLKEFLYHSKGVFNNYYAFEPDKKNYAILEKNAKGINGVELFNIGCSNRRDELCFEGSSDGVSNSGARISENGNEVIKVNRIDNMLESKRVTFIKMDIEGEEKNALEGAWGIIESQRPKLAICIYHSHEDMVNIPYDLMQKLNDYRFFIRHYNIDKIETVLYGIPY